MPFYPALPEYKPMDIAGNIGAGLALPFNLQYTAMRSAAMKEAIEAERNKRTALQQYQATGDPRTLYPALTPEQALEAPGKLQAQQLGLGIKASDFFQNQLPSLSWDTYPKVRENALKDFPGLAELHFPPPEQLGGPEGFEKWRTDKAERVALFNSMPEVIKARGKMSLEEYKAKQKLALEREKIAGKKETAGISAAGRVKAAEIKADADKRKQEDKGVKAFDLFRKDPRIAKLPEADQVREYHKSLAVARETPMQKEKRKGITEEGKIMKRLGRAVGVEDEDDEEGEGGEGLVAVKNSRTGKTEYVTKEQFEQIKKLRSGK